MLFFLQAFHKTKISVGFKQPFTALWVTQILWLTGLGFLFLGTLRQWGCFLYIRECLQVPGIHTGNWILYFTAFHPCIFHCPSSGIYYSLMVKSIWLLQKSDMLLVTNLWRAPKALLFFDHSDKSPESWTVQADNT